MTSEMAKADIEQMKAEGLDPTVEDIIRLNALALKVERERSKDSFKCFYTLPRVAAVSKHIWFRQPTVGHEIWFDKVARYADMDDYSTVLALNAYALSRSQSELVDPDDRDAVIEAMNESLKLFADCTKEQLHAAIKYVKNGISQETGEYPISKPSKDDEEPDWCECVALGSLNEGKAVLFGISERDMLNMTRKELDAVVERAYKMHGMDSADDNPYSLGQYYYTLDKIRERLIQTKEEKIWTRN